MIIIKILKGLDSFNRSIGRWVSWLIFTMAILVTAIVALRTFWQSGSIAAQEAVTYMHAAVFMLAMALTLQENGHVRVDVIYRRFTEEQRAWVNTLGTLLFLIPFAVFLLGISWEFTARAWAIRESSADAGGIPAVYLLKTLIPLSALLLLLQALAELLRGGLAITYRQD